MDRKEFDELLKKVDALTDLLLDEAEEEEECEFIPNGSIVSFRITNKVYDALEDELGEDFMRFMAIT